MITHSAKETGQQKEQWVWGVRGGRVVGMGRVVGQNLKKEEGRQYEGSS